MSRWGDHKLSSVELTVLREVVAALGQKRASRHLCIRRIVLKRIIETGGASEMSLAIVRKRLCITIPHPEQVDADSRAKHKAGLAARWMRPGAREAARVRALEYRLRIGDPRARAQLIRARAGSVLGSAHGTPTPADAGASPVR